MTVEWSVEIQIFKPLLSFERPLHIEVEVQSDASYNHEGRFHKNQKHIIILFTYSGQGFFRDPIGTYDLNPGTCLLCNPGDPEICYQYPPKNKDPWRFIWFGFTGGFVQKKAKDLWGRFGPVFQLSLNSKLIKELESFHSYDNITYEMSPFDGSSLVMDVFTELGKSWSSKESSENILVRKTNALIRDQLDEKISIARIAQSLHVSREHLSRVFKECTGSSLQQYILQRKVAMACKLLKETNLSIKQITAQLGFADQRNFARTFQNYAHLTPKEFRKSGIAMLL